MWLLQNIVILDGSSAPNSTNPASGLQSGEGTVTTGPQGFAAGGDTAESAWGLSHNPSYADGRSGNYTPALN